MLDPHTGALTLADSALSLSPGMVRSDFLSSTFGAGASPKVLNGPHKSYSRAVAPGELGDQPFWLDLYFYDDSLEAITLTLQGVEFGQSWSDWSEAKERARKAAHDRWLEASGVPPGVYTWGKVESELDEKSGGSGIFVRYRWQGKPWPRVT